VKARKTAPGRVSYHWKLDGMTMCLRIELKRPKRVERRKKKGFRHDGVPYASVRRGKRLSSRESVALPKASRAVCFSGESKVGRLSH